MQPQHTMFLTETQTKRMNVFNDKVVRGVAPDMRDSIAVAFGCPEALVRNVIARNRMLDIERRNRPTVTTERSRLDAESVRVRARYEEVKKLGEQFDAKAANLRRRRLAILDLL